MAGKVDLQADKKVLEVGSGTGKGALYMAQVGKTLMYHTKDQI